MSTWFAPVTTLAAFEIIGVPAPQGSKSRMPNGALLESSSTSGRLKLKSWRQAVAETSRDVADDEPYDGFLALSVTFRMPMPASRPKKAREQGWWPCAVTPDLDKLLRSLGDGMKAGGLIADDARIMRIDAEKIEVTGWTGASISLQRVIVP